MCVPVELWGSRDKIEDFARRLEKITLYPAEKKEIYNLIFAPVAQLDRVFGYEPKGQGFESLMACQNNGYRFCGVRYFLFYETKKGFERVGVE